jgi:hypothetical protein
MLTVTYTFKDEAELTAHLASRNNGQAPTSNTEKSSLAEVKKPVAEKPAAEKKLKPAAATPAPTEAPKAAAPAAAGKKTIDDARAALQAVVKKHGIDEGTAFLKKFGFNRVSEIPAEKIAEFVEQADQKAGA